MANLIHKRGKEISISIDQARKKAKIEAGDDIPHPYNVIKGNFFDDDISLKSCIFCLSENGTKNCTSNNRPTKCTCMIDLALDDDMLVATGTLMRVQTGRTKNERDLFLIEYSCVFERKKRKVTNKRH